MSWFDRFVWRKPAWATESNEFCLKSRNLPHLPGADYRPPERFFRERSCAKALTTRFSDPANKRAEFIRVSGDNWKAGRLRVGFHRETACASTMPTPPDRRGLFLDLDGTLADSLGVLRRVYFCFLREFNQEGSDAEFDRLNGPKLSEIVGALQKKYH